MNYHDSFRCLFLDSFSFLSPHFRTQGGHPIRNSRRSALVLCIRYGGFYQRPGRAGVLDIPLNTAQALPKDELV
jgi:hypothetical protein